MEILLFDSDHLLLEKLRSKLGNVGKKLSFFDDMIFFISYLRKTFICNNKMIAVISEDMLKLFDIDINYFMIAYDLHIPVFSYNCSNKTVKIKINYLNEFAKEDDKDYISDIIEIKNILQDSLIDIMDVLPQDYLFSENLINKKTRHSLKKSIFSENISSSSEVASNVFSSLSKFQIRLLTYLKEHKSGASISDIQQALWHSDSNDKVKNLYSLISGTRHALKNTYGNKYEIINTRNGYQLITISED